MPGNQSGGGDGDVELKVGYMVKRSQGKSTLGATNFKKRVFVLTPSRLSYYDGTLEVSGIQLLLGGQSISSIETSFEVLYMLRFTCVMPYPHCVCVETQSEVVS